MFNLQEQERIFTAWEWCDDNEKSTEFTLQYVSDVADVDYDELVDYIVSDVFTKQYDSYLRTKWGTGYE